MKLSFTVEVVLDVPDKVVREKIAEANECEIDEVDVKNDVDALSVGMFGDLILDPLTSSVTGAKLDSYCTGQYVDIVKSKS